MNWNFKRRPTEEKDKRLYRILSILAMLQGIRVSGYSGVRVSECPSVQVSKLSEEFNVSERQVLRDLNSLSVAGFPLETTREGHNIFWKLSRA